jgi:type 1 glutamine amidotransferase
VKQILVLSKNDQWHKLEDLGARIVDWAKGIDGVEVRGSHDRGILAADELGAYDVCVLCITMSDLSDGEEQGLARFVGEGKVAFGLHAAAVTDEDRETYIDLIGGRFTHHPRYAEFEVKIVDADHPISKDVTDFSVSDELYILDRTPRDARILATATWEGAEQPLVYVKPYGQGTVVYNALGHDSAAWEHPAFRALVTQGLAWAYQR